MFNRLLLLSTSTVHGSGYLDYCADHVAAFLQSIPQVLFIPYARPSGISHAEYTKKTRERFALIGVELTGIDTAADARSAVRDAAALFIGGGNTFLLLKDLYAAGLPGVIRQRVAAGMPYVGSSAGSNVAGLTIGTTNDMPIVFPPSFDALGLVPFNINPHYVDPDPESTHKGETRETRINEFHTLNRQPVVALREGAWLRVDADTIRLEGTSGARLFRQGVAPAEFETGARLDFLLEERQ
ncbi:MAG: dipeptidase PepE [Gemmatimonadota bacterium]|nr:MAG: dipeptidase PepE [Gemmatimonadota bacterium]